ncbi:MAG TPA: hypothetical protein VGL04_04055 [Sporichthyaceae bacterium]
MWIALWVLLGVAGLIAIAIPAVRLFWHVRVLGREVRRVSRDLRDASAALQQASDDLPRNRH